MFNKNFSFLLTHQKKLFFPHNKRRKNKRRRGRHLHSFFSTRKKKYLLYYQSFDSKLVKKDVKVHFKAPFNSTKNTKHKIGLKSLKLHLIPINSLKALRFSSQRYLKSLYLDKYFKYNVSVVSDFWLTAKPKSVRMGKGKGDLKFKVFFLSKGMHLYNFRYVNKFKHYNINKKLFFHKFNIFVWLLMNILKGKPAVKNTIYKKIL